MEKQVENSKPQSEEPQPFSRRAKIITTIVIFYGNVAYGCAMNAFSPALTDFKNKFDTDTSTISVVFTASIGAYMVGALLCTVLYNLVNRQLCVIFIFIAISATMVLAPYAPNITIFYVLGGILGFSIGCYDSAQFVWLMEMWQAESGPFVQAQHFSFAVGTVISPVVMSPFLTKDEDEDGVTTTTPAEKNVESKVYVPFLIFGCLCGITAVAQMILFIFMRYRPPPPEVGIIKPDLEDLEKKKLQNQDKNVLVRWFLNQWPGWKIARLVILSGLNLGFYQGMEMATMQLFPTFGQNSDVGLSESAAANTLTGLTIAFMVGRGLSIILIFKVPPLFIHIGNISLVAIANVILVIWGNSSESVIWAAGILYGLGFSSMLPSFCSYMERYLEFTNTIGAMMIVSGSFVGALYPLIAGGFIDDHPLVISYPVFLSLVVVISSAAISFSITRKTKNRVGE